MALAAFSFAVLFGRLVVVPLAARAGIQRTLPFAFLVMASGLLVIAGTQDTVVVAGAAAVVGSASSLTFPALASLVVGRVAPAQRGAAMGALIAFYDVYVGIASVVAGLVIEYWDTSAVFVLAAIGVLAAAAANALLLSRGLDQGAVDSAGPAPNM